MECSKEFNLHNILAMYNIKEIYYVESSIIKNENDKLVL